MAVDAGQNIYIAGVFASQITIDGQTRVSQGGLDIYLAKLTKNGGLVWLKSFGSSGDDQPLGLVLDSQDRVWLAGYFVDSIEFGGGQLRSAGEEDIFIARFNASGNHEMSSSYGGTGSDTGTYLAAGANQEVYLAGSFASPALTLGSARLTRSGEIDGFFARINANGAFSWVKHLPAAPGKYAEAFAAAMGRNNDVFVGGYIEAASHSVFVEKLNKADGNRVWRQEFACGGWCNAASLSAAPDGEIYVAGNFEATLLVNGTMHRSQGESDHFLARLRAANGTAVWSKRLGGLGYDIGMSIEAAANGAIYVAGTVVGSIDFGGGALAPGAGNSGIGLARYYSSGTHQWSELYVGTLGTGTGAGYNGDGFIRLIPDGNLVVNGWFLGDITVDNTQFRSLGSWDSILIFHTP